MYVYVDEWDGLTFNTFEGEYCIRTLLGRHIVLAQSIAIMSSNFSILNGIKSNFNQNSSRLDDKVLFAIFGCSFLCVKYIAVIVPIVLTVERVWTLFSPQVSAN